MKKLIKICFMLSVPALLMACVQDGTYVYAEDYGTPAQVYSGPAYYTAPTYYRAHRHYYYAPAPRNGYSSHIGGQAVPPPPPPPNNGYRSYMSGPTPPPPPPPPVAQGGYSSAQHPLPPPARRVSNEPTSGVMGIVNSRLKAKQQAEAEAQGVPPAPPTIPGAPAGAGGWSSSQR